MIGVLSEAHAGRAPGEAEGEGRRTGALGRGFRLLGRGSRQDPKAERRSARSGGPRLPGSFLSRIHHGAVQPLSSPLPLSSSERVRNRGPEQAPLAGRGLLPNAGLRARLPCFVVTGHPGFGAFPDPSSPRVTCVVIPSVRLELIHLGLLTPLCLLYTLYRDFFFT